MHAVHTQSRQSFVVLEAVGVGLDAEIWDLAPGTALCVGSADGNDIQLTMPGVAGLHCEIECDEGGIQLIPHDSRLWIDGAAITTRVALQAGNEIIIGPAVLRARFADSSELSDLPRSDCGLDQITHESEQFGDLRKHVESLQRQVEVQGAHLHSSLMQASSARNGNASSDAMEHRIRELDHREAELEHQTQEFLSQQQAFVQERNEWESRHQESVEEIGQLSQVRDTVGATENQDIQALRDELTAAVADLQQQSLAVERRLAELAIREAGLKDREVAFEAACERLLEHENFCKPEAATDDFTPQETHGAPGFSLSEPCENEPMTDQPVLKERARVEPACSSTAAEFDADAGSLELISAGHAGNQTHEGFEQNESISSLRSELADMFGIRGGETNTDNSCVPKGAAVEACDETTRLELPASDETPDVSLEKNVDDDDYIHSYMQQLISESRGHTGGDKMDVPLSTVQTTPRLPSGSLGESHPSSLVETSQSTEVSETNSAREPDQPSAPEASPLPRQPQDKARLRAFIEDSRALANTHARSAIATHARKRTNGQFMFRAVMMVASFATAIGTWWGWQEGLLQQIHYALAMTALGMIFAIQLVYSVLQRFTLSTSGPPAVAMLSNETPEPR